MPRLERKHSLATRLFHWANVPILAVMICSGLLIYWANDVYAIRLGGITLVKFFPDWFYRALHVDHRLAEGMAWHFTFMWLFAINGLLYVGYTAWSGEWRHLVPNRHTFAEAWQVVLHDLGCARSRCRGASSTGPAAGLYRGGRDGGRLAADGPGDLQTGPARLAHHAAGRIPAGAARAFRLTVGYVAFFVIHITQVIRAGWNNFRAMVIGVEVAEDEEISYEYAGRPDGAPESTPAVAPPRPEAPPAVAPTSTRSSAGRRTASTRE